MFVGVLLRGLLRFAIEKRERAEERRRQKFPAALFAVEINVKQIAGIELRFIPRTPS
jgi:hypothetical protein